MQLEDKNEADVEDFEASIYIMHIGRPDMYLECVVVKLVLYKMTKFFREKKALVLQNIVPSRNLLNVLHVLSQLKNDSSI